MPTKKKTAAKAAEGPALFKLERNVPVPDRSTKTEAAVLRAKLDEIIPSMKKTQSFVIKKSQIGTVRNYLRTAFSSMDFKSSDIRPDRKFTRVWRTK